MERTYSKTIVPKIIKNDEEKIYQTVDNNYDGNRCIIDFCSIGMD